MDRGDVFCDPRGEGGDQAFACGGNPGDKIGLGLFSDHGVKLGEPLVKIAQFLLQFLNLVLNRKKPSGIFFNCLSILCRRCLLVAAPIDTPGSRTIPLTTGLYVSVGV